MDYALKKAFETLNEEELAPFLPPDAALPDADEGSISRIKVKTLQKAGLTPVGKEPAMKKITVMKHWKVWVVAAALVVLIAFSAVAAVKLIPPKAMIDDLLLNPNTLTAAETGRREQRSNELLFTLEGVTEGKLPAGYTFNGERPADDSSTYAIVSIRSENGKPFWYADDEKGYHADNFGFTVLVSGFAPNGSMFKTDYYHDGRYFYEDEANNVLYCAYDITNALCFADRGVLLQVCDGMASGPEEIRIDKNGSFYFEESYPGIRVIFDLNLDPALANPEKAAEWEKEACFNTYEEIAADYRAQGIDYDHIKYEPPGYDPDSDASVPTTEPCSQPAE
ncbi:MAG: hypothetical protein II804_05455 [Clostridia bacterium]|nr:hypothetical protein [Clostridia bacterium]